MSYSLRIVILLTIACILGGVITGQSYYYRFAYVWGFIILISWLYTQLSLVGLSIRRTPRTLRSQVGQIFEERFEIINHRSIPRIWVEVKDDSTLPGIKQSHILTLIRSHEVRTFVARTRLLERGVFSLGETELLASDFFGLFSVKKKFPAVDHLLVYPMMVPINSFPSPAGWLAGGEALRRRTHQITPNAAGVRDYVQGDPLNRIHWLSTARRNRFIVKEYELDPMAEVWIFLDVERNNQFEIKEELPKLEMREMWRPSVSIPLPASTVEYAVCIAASLSRYYLKNGRVVGFVSAGKNLWVLPSDRGARQMGKILETLALIRGDGNLPLQAVVNAQIQNLARGSTILLITPSSEEKITPLVISLIQRGMHPIVIFLDRHSFRDEAIEIPELNLSVPATVPVFHVKKGDKLENVLSQDNGKVKFKPQ